MFKRTNKVNKIFTINADQLNSFATILEAYFLYGIEDGQKWKFRLNLTRVDTPSGEEIIVVDINRIEEDLLNRFLSKLNKYGVKVA